MGSHPINLALRFLLELTALGTMGYWGWTQHNAPLRYVLALGVPVLAMILWSTFRVDGDPGAAPVAIPGLLRLVLEFAVFGGAVWMLVDADRSTLAIALAVIVLAHYVVSYDRIQWLLAR